MNLITDRWIPVRDNNGKSLIIRPSEIVSHNCFLDFPRPDFNLAGLFFLIGLVQLVRGSLTSKPSEKVLHNLLTPYADYFNLIGKDKIFMQDNTLEGKIVPIFYLFLDGVKGNEITLRKDFFRKQNTIEALCPSCSAITLYTSQLFAPVGGQGYNPSPLKNSLLCYNLKETLWDTVFSNTSLDFKCFGNGEIPTPATIFPWQQPSTDLKVLWPKLTPAEHLYWFNPWRIKLCFEEANMACDCCGQQSQLLSRQYHRGNKGIEYASTSIVFYTGSPKEDLTPGDIGETIKEGENSSEVSFGRKSLILNNDEFQFLQKKGLAWMHPLTVHRSGDNKKEGGNKIGVTFGDMDHVMASEILYGLDSYATVAPLQDGQVVLCGNGTMKGAHVKYLSWFEKVLFYASTNKERVIKLLNIERDFWDVFYKCSFPIADRGELGNNLRRALDPIFYDLIREDAPNIEELWIEQLTQFYIKAFDSYLPESFSLRQKLIEGLSAKKTHIPKHKVKYFRPKRLNSDAIKVLLKWWYWINNYSKTSKMALRNYPSWEKVKENKEAFLSPLFSKLSSVLYPVDSEAIPENMINRISLATYLVVQLKEDSKERLEWPYSEEGSFERVAELKSFFKSRKKANIINIFNQILFN